MYRNIAFWHLNMKSKRAVTKRAVTKRAVSWFVATGSERLLGQFGERS